jgi:eukaryotic-like serine/threonine-protein kinase
VPRASTAGRADIPANQCINPLLDGGNLSGVIDLALSPGDKLGPYEILVLIGKGGMGEVYRAHDDRLHRDVAIKSSNSEFKERFIPEARAIAALNHTNICHL